eukprot:m.143590 g.143590  ORF g.143590 m.143590 type:complete len:1883 (+) comp38394_c1_seq23:49-5697(+)
MTSQKSRAFSIRPNRKEEMEFRKEIERIRLKSKQIPRTEDQNNVQQSARKRSSKPSKEFLSKTHAEVKSAGSSKKAQMEKTYSEERNPKRLAVVSSLNTTMPAPFIERKPTSMPQPKLPSKPSKGKEADSGLSRPSQGRPKPWSRESQDSVRVTSRKMAEEDEAASVVSIGGSRERSAALSVRMPIVHEVPTVGSDICDEERDLRSRLTSLGDDRAETEETKEEIKSLLVTPEEMENDTIKVPVSGETVEPFSTESEYAELLDELSQPISVMDVIHVRGKASKLTARQITATNQRTMEPVKAARVDHSSMHDFCHLPADFQKTSHSHQHYLSFYQEKTFIEPVVPPPSELSHSFTIITEEDPDGFKYVANLLDGVGNDFSLANYRGLMRRPMKGKTSSPVKGDLDPRQWSNHLASLLGNLMKTESMNVEGAQCEVVTDQNELNWCPAPPKLSIHPDFIQSELFPEYHGISLAADGSKVVADEMSDEEREIEKLEDSRLAQEEAADLQRILGRRCGSARDLTEISRLQVATPLLPSPLRKSTVRETPDTLEEEGSYISTTLDQVSESDEGVSKRETGFRDDHEITITSSTPSLGLKAFAGYQLASARKQTFAQLQGNWAVGGRKDDCDNETEAADTPSDVPLRRAISQPFLTTSSPVLTVPSEYGETMKELEEQKLLLAKAKEGVSSPQAIEQSAIWTQSFSSSGSNIIASPSLPKGNRGAKMSLQRQSTIASHEINVLGLTRKRRGSKTTNKPLTKAMLKRIKYLLAVLNQYQLEGTRPSRRASVTCFEYCIDRSGFPPKQKMTVNPGRLQHASSVVIGDSEETFDRWMAESSSSPPLADTSKSFTWAQIKWDEWFDEMYSEAQQSRPKSAFTDTVVHLKELENLEPITNESNQELVQVMQAEVERLTSLIDTSPESIAFNLCRRGALYRKLGRLKDAAEDLNKAIDVENGLLDAYWHRHLLHLLQNNEQAALSDLSFITKHSKTQSRAYRSTAEILAGKGDLTMAIANYSLAIKLEPNNGEAYYRRAQFFERRKDFVSALEDYAMASKLIPSKLEAFFKKGKYNFESGFWTAAVEDFTAILKQEPGNALVRTYRGRTYAKQERFHEALADLSAAIHLNANSSIAFYHRGCLLRRADPQKALKDLSVSLLLDNSAKNVLAYFHRGILYTDMKQFMEAIPDFEACVKLNRSIPGAHVNLGLICMQHLNDYERAIHCFSHAIRADPTYVRAYVCRADGYSLVGKLDDAVRDYSRAIHLNPVVPRYHLYRGKLLLRKGQLEKAAAHVRHAADLDKASLGASVMQQAVVESFLHNYDQAISLIDSAVSLSPSPGLFILAGRTHMKAKEHEKAILSFEGALQAMATPIAATNLPCSRAEVHFFIGQSYEELQQDDRALAAYNAAIRRDPRLSKAFYRRGLVRFKLRQSRAVTDFNRALAVDPSLFQAYLSRAAYYALNKRYTKAILNCNESARLQPYSVRTYLYRGALKYCIGAYEQAIEDLGKAIWIDKCCSLAFYNRACCFQQMKRNDEALRDYSVVLLMDSGPDLKVLINRGLLYFDIRDYGNALLDFLAAAEYLGTDAKLFHTIGLCHHRLNKLAYSIASFTRVLQLDHHFIEALVCRGNAYTDLRTDYGNTMALRDYCRAILLDPTCLAARVNMGLTLQTMGKFQKAWMQFTGAHNIDSSYIPALEGRAVVSLQMRKFFAASLDLGKAIQMRPSAELLTNRGVVHQFTRNVVNAMRDFQAAIKLDSSYSLAYFNAANVYFGQRQFHRALEYYTKALESEPNDESMLLNRAITRVVLGQTDEALEDFNKAALYSPHWAHIYYNRGNLYKSLGRFAEAEMDYTRALALQPGDSLVYSQRADVIAKQDREDEALDDYKKAVYLES